MHGSPGSVAARRAEAGRRCALFLRGRRRKTGEEEHTHGEVREETSDDDLRPGSAVAGGAPKRIFSLPASRARRPKARAGQRDGWATATECQRFIICFRFADRSVLLTGLARAVGRGAEGRCLDKKEVGRRQLRHGLAALQQFRREHACVPL